MRADLAGVRAMPRALALARIATGALVLAGLAGAFGLAAFACGSETIGGGGAGDADATPPVDAAEAEAAPSPRGARVLGLGLDLASPGLVADIALARDAGVTTTNLSFAWDEIEVPYDAGAGDGGDAGPATALYAPALHAVNLIFPDVKTSVSLAIPAVDVGGPRLPADLSGRTLDDPEVLARFELAEDYVLSQLPDTDLTALLVGDAVDAPLGDDPARWAAFAVFVARAATHAKTVRASAKVGFTVSADGLVARKDRMAAAIAASDLVAVTYVPIDAAARARPVTGVAADVVALLAAAPLDKPIVLRAVGYPSDPACGSDDAAQAAFVSAVFSAWDSAASRVGVLTFAALDDPTDAIVAARAARAGRADAPFLAMLGSLGFRTAGGRVKPSLGAFRAEARARGW